MIFWPFFVELFEKMLHDTVFDDILDNFSNLASFTIEVALILFFSAPEES